MSDLELLKSQRETFQVAVELSKERQESARLKGMLAQTQQREAQSAIQGIDAKIAELMSKAEPPKAP